MTDDIMLKLVQTFTPVAVTSSIPFIRLVGSTATSHPTSKESETTRGHGFPGMPSVIKVEMISLKTKNHNNKKRKTNNKTENEMMGGSW